MERVIEIKEALQEEVKKTVEKLSDSLVSINFKINTQEELLKESAHSLKNL